jgi:hypothetical protein
VRGVFHRWRRSHCTNAYVLQRISGHRPDSHDYSRAHVHSRAHDVNIRADDQPV